MRLKSLPMVLYALFLINIGGCKKDSNNPVNTPTVITVNGFVKSANGYPLSGAHIIINANAPITTASDGSFSLANVTVPYDLSMVLVSQKLVVIYKGLTRTDPVLPSFATDALGTATLTGTIPTVAGTTTLIAFVSGTVSGSTITSSGNYSMTVQWAGSASSYAGHLYLLRWTTPAGGTVPSSYGAYGQKAVTISSGSFANNFIEGDLTDPSEQALSGTVARPTTAYVHTGRDYVISFGSAVPEFYFGGEAGNPLTDNFNITVPNITGVTIGISAYCRQTIGANIRYTISHKGGLTAGMSGISIPVANAPQLTAPVDQATGVDSMTSFVFVPGLASGGIHEAYVYPSASSNPRFIIYTASNSFRLPNLTGLGLGLPPSGAYYWYAMRLHPIASVDAIAASSNNTFFGNGNWGEEQSETFHFTTKP